MSDPSGTEKRADQLLALQDLPKPVLQEIYHAVTGKTETLSDVHKGNVIINGDDLDRLRGMLLDQLALLPSTLDPTVTVVVKSDKGRAVTYSSWERFKTLYINNYDVTSELTIRFEFLVHLPATSSPQRCTLNVNLDSSLPVLVGRNEELAELDPFSLFILVPEWRTVRTSIDFVDFLVAKGFSAVVHEWFLTLARQPNSKIDIALARHQTLIYRVLQQAGRVGMATYLLAFCILFQNTELNLRIYIMAGAIGLFIWSLIIVLESTISKKTSFRINTNIIHSTILLSERDRECYAEIVKNRTNPTTTIFGFIASISGALIINIAASYIFMLLTHK